MAISTTFEREQFSTAQHRRPALLIVNYQLVTSYDSLIRRY